MQCTILNRYILWEKKYDNENPGDKQYRKIVWHQMATLGNSYYEMVIRYDRQTYNFLKWVK